MSNAVPANVTIVSGSASATWSPQRYVEAVRTGFRRIAETAVGRAVLAEVQARPLRIYPFHELGGKDRPVTKAANPVGGLLAGEPLSLCDPNHSGRGDGSGSEVAIYFTPGHWTEHKWMTPSSMLLHELVHASRYMRGLAACNPLKGFENEEEYFAMLVANMYRSERGLNDNLRESYDPAQSNVASYMRRKYGREKDMIVKLRRQQRRLFEALAAIRGLKFNPIRRADGRLDRQERRAARRAAR